MKLRALYRLTFLAKLPDGFDKHFKLVLESKTFQLSNWDDTGLCATAIIEIPVNRDELTVQAGRERLDGSVSSKGILVPEQMDVSQFLPRIVHILSFLTDIPIWYGRLLDGDMLIAESSEDEDFINNCGTQEIYTPPITVTVLMRTFSLSSVNTETLDALAKKELGLALYGQALLIQEPIAAYREFWKLLESAFSTKDKELIGCLADFAPAQQLGFTKDELKELLILRGRASHVESQSGVKEYEFVFTETSRWLPRLKCLAERVVLTKKTWGVRTTDTEELAAITGYLDANNCMVLIKPSLATQNKDWC